MTLLSSLHDLHQLLGQEAVSALVQRWGGVRLYVPTKFRPDHPIAQCISQQHFRTLVDHYGGETLSIPRHVQAPIKKSAIIDLLDRSLSHRQIALKVGVSQRYVEKVAAMIRA